MPIPFSCSFVAGTFFRVNRWDFCPTHSQPALSQMISQFPNQTLQMVSSGRPYRMKQTRKHIGSTTCLCHAAACNNIFQLFSVSLLCSSYFFFLFSYLFPLSNLFVQGLHFCKIFLVLSELLQS